MLQNLIDQPDDDFVVLVGRLVESSRIVALNLGETRAQSVSSWAAFFASLSRSLCGHLYVSEDVMEALSDLPDLLEAQGINLPAPVPGLSRHRGIVRALLRANREKDGYRVVRETFPWLGLSSFKTWWGPNNNQHRYIAE